MMKNKRNLAGLAALTILLGAFTSCASSGSSTGSASTPATAGASTEAASSESKSASSESKTASSAAAAETVSYTANTSGLLDTTDAFTTRDLEQTADLSEAEYITLADGEDISITTAGVFVLSGSAQNCTITVEAASDEKVQLVLDGAEIYNDDFPAIYVISADKCFITTT